MPPGLLSHLYRLSLLPPFLLCGDGQGWQETTGSLGNITEVDADVWLPCGEGRQRWVRDELLGSHRVCRDSDELCLFARKLLPELWQRSGGLRAGTCRYNRGSCAVAGQQLRTTGFPRA